MPTALPVILFDDGRGQLAPLKDLRPAFDVRVGALTLFERIVLMTGRPPAGLIVPRDLESICREKWPSIPVNGQISISGECLLINGRWAVASSRGLHEIDELGGTMHDDSGESLGHRASPTRLAALVHDGLAHSEGFRYEGLTEGSRTLLRPWDARKLRDQALAIDLELLLRTSPTSAALTAGVTLIGDKGLNIAATARLYPSVVLDCESGPIVIDTHAVIRPGAIISGPAYIGPHSTALDRAVIRGNTAIGPHCKVAGEVSGTVFQGYSNKAHDGFLGDSWVGEWVNLGAGTTNSNLLNTYSEIICRATPDGPNERTGETFLGAIIGDHVKTAICTRIMTGSILHTGSMFATTAPVSGTVSRFTWATDAGSRAYRFEKFLDVARSAMARRKVEPSAAYIDRLRSLARAGKEPD
jgi:UDP-N-acetylglucosamine diphosphorylase/glucosamine-1-phosphate N-acetyltransferase